MKRSAIIFWLITTVISFCLNMLGLMHIIPLFLTIPLLCGSILCTLWTLNNRNRFKGFQQKRMW